MPRKSDIQAEEVAAVSSPVRRSTRRAATPSNIISSETTSITTKAVRTRRSSQDSTEKIVEKIDLKTTRARRAVSTEPANEEERKPVRGRRASVTDEPKTETPVATRARRSSVTGKTVEENKVDLVGVDEIAKGTPKVTRRRRSLSVDIEEPIANESKPATRSRRLSTDKQEETVQTPAKKAIRTRRSSVEKLEETEPKTPKTRRRPSISLDPINEQSESSRKSQSPKTEAAIMQDVVIKLTPLKKTLEPVASQMDLSIIQEDSLLEDNEEKPNKTESQLSLEKSPRGENTLGSEIIEAPDTTSNVTRKSPRLSSGKKSISPLKQKSLEMDEKVEKPKTQAITSESTDNSEKNKSQSDLNTSNNSDKENIPETMVDSPKITKMPLVLTEVNKINEIPPQDITVARVSNVFRPRGIEYSFAEPMEVDELESTKIAGLDKTSLEESKLAGALQHDESVDESFKLRIETTNVEEESQEEKSDISQSNVVEPENSDTRKLLLTSEHEKILGKIHGIEEVQTDEDKTNDITDYEFHIQSDDDQTDSKFDEDQVSQEKAQTPGKDKELGDVSIVPAEDATTQSKIDLENSGEDTDTTEVMEVQTPMIEIASEKFSAKDVHPDEPGTVESSNQGVENTNNEDNCVTNSEVTRCTSVNESDKITEECEETNLLDEKDIDNTQDDSNILDTTNENDDDPDQIEESTKRDKSETELVSPYILKTNESALPPESSKDGFDDSLATEDIGAKNDSEAVQHQSGSVEEEPQTVLESVPHSDDLDQEFSSTKNKAEEPDTQCDVVISKKIEKLESVEQIETGENIVESEKENSEFKSNEETIPVTKINIQTNDSENLLQGESEEKGIEMVEVVSKTSNLTGNENEATEDFNTSIISQNSVVEQNKEGLDYDVNNSTEQELADECTEQLKASTETLDGSLESAHSVEEIEKEKSKKSPQSKTSSELKDQSENIEADTNVSVSKLESSKKDRRSYPKSKSDSSESAESKLDKYISEKLSNYQQSSSEEADEDEEDVEEEEKETNEFIDDMAMEGEEDTPSEDSNQIIDEGESLNSSDSHVESDDEYDEDDSFICDAEEVELLSGEEYDLGDERVKKKKKSRIINVEDDESDIIKIKKKDKPTTIRKKSRIVKVSSSESEVALSDDDNLKNEDDTNKVENNISPHKRRSTDAAGPSSPNVKGSNETTRRSSITIHENVSVKELQDCALSERINLIVGSFCNKIKKGDISMNLSLEYEGKSSESSSSPPPSSSKSPTGLKRWSDQGMESSPLKKIKVSPEVRGSKSNLKRRLSKSADNVSDVQNKKKKKRFNKKVKANVELDSYSLFDDLVTDVKNRPRRKVKPCKSISEFNTSWTVELVHVKPSTSLVSEKEKEDFKRKKIHPKDFRQHMLYDSSRVRREDTKSMMRKRGVY